MARKSLRQKVDRATADLREWSRTTDLTLGNLDSQMANHFKPAIDFIGNDRQLKKAFADAELDSQNPMHWVQLIKEWAAILYARPGKQTIWTAEKSDLFLARFDDERARMLASGKKPSVKQVCISLKKKFSDYKIPVEGLRSRYYLALRQRTRLNEDLRHISVRYLRWEGFSARPSDPREALLQSLVALRNLGIQRRRRPSRIYRVMLDEGIGAIRRQRG